LLQILPSGQTGAFGAGLAFGSTATSVAAISAAALPFFSLSLVLVPA